MVLRSIILKFRSRRTPKYIIDRLFKRCYATNSTELLTQQEWSLEKMGAKLGGGGSEKEILNYPIASSKEIEFELEKFLLAVKKKGKREFIFVFDELDKIEPAALTADYFDVDAKTGEQQAGTYLEQIRQRKQSVINIIAGLKNFLTSAEARFVFIAGREMFDANLADVADRQSSISSIFNYVFYIESFLKENLEQDNIKSSLSACIEYYLIYVIFGKQAPEGQYLALSDLLHECFEKKQEMIRQEIIKLKNVNDAQAKAWKEAEEIRLNRLLHKNKHGYNKSLVILQNFIVYLTYRSNGSPKKIIKLIQEFIQVEKPEGMDKPSCFLVNTQPDEKPQSKRIAYLFFGFADQYRIGFINHLYRPFLIRHGQSFNKYSDNIILSTTYLLDHLLKFHPFAFSIPNLELTPEVLSTNKTPLLREHILTIIEYLSNNHLRETEIDIFDYKFYSRTQSELIYISKTFESESAAFNFTMDEGYLVKLNIRNKLKSLREIHNKDNDQHSSVMSISHLNGILGDLHFFDQEYDEAIVAYSDCIKLIGDTDSSLENYIRSQRFKLKLGLTLEKVKSYDEALAFYGDAARASLEFFHKLQGNASSVHDLLPVVNDVLQIANQAFLALIVLQEKVGINGNTIGNLLRTLERFIGMSMSIDKFSRTNYLIRANINLVAGNLIFFKNNNVVDMEEVNYAVSFRHITTLVDGLRYTSAKSQSSAFAFYYQGLCELIHKDERCEFDSGIENLMFKHFSGPTLGEVLRCNNTTKNEFKYIAIFLSHIGDCLLSELQVETNSTDFHCNQLTIDQIFKNELTDDFLNLLFPSKEGEIGITDVLRCYYWSARFFERRGRLVSKSFQLRKILYVLQTVIKADHTKYSNYTMQLGSLEQLILKPILDIASSTAEHSDYQMVSKFQNTKFNPKLPFEKKAFNIFLNNNISNHPDTREAVTLFLYIKLKLSPKPTIPEYDQYRTFISPNNSFATQYTRIHELNFWAKLNLLRYEQVKAKWSDTALRARNKAESKKGLYMYALDYLHAQFSALLMMDIYGADYTIGHSHKGFIHYSIAVFLGQWNKDADQEQINIDSFVRFICHQIGFNPSGPMANEGYHYFMAVSHMEKACQLHTQGHEYRKNMDNLIYLEDDINDNAYHFGAAMDRYLMTNNTFNDIIERSKKKLDELRYNFNKDISEKYFQAADY